MIPILSCIADFAQVTYTLEYTKQYFQDFNHLAKTITAIDKFLLKKWFAQQKLWKTLKRLYILREPVWGFSSIKCIRWRSYKKKRTYPVQLQSCLPKAITYSGAFIPPQRPWRCLRKTEYLFFRSVSTQPTSLVSGHGITCTCRVRRNPLKKKNPKNIKVTSNKHDKASVSWLRLIGCRCSLL